jgi:hypothetical protein
MSSTVTMITLALFVGGSPVHDNSADRIGPFPDAASCFEFRDQVSESIATSIKFDNVYGLITDQWGLGGGAIMRAQDHTQACVIETRDGATNELVKELLFW